MLKRIEQTSLRYPCCVPRKTIQAICPRNHSVGLQKIQLPDDSAEDRQSRKAEKNQDPEQPAENHEDTPARIRAVLSKPNELHGKSDKKTASEQRNCKACLLHRQ